MGSTKVERVVIAGFTGLIGRYLVHTAPRDVAVTCIARRSDHISNGGNSELLLDLATSTNLSSLICNIAPNLVIHAAGESRVDFAATNVESARVSIVRSTEMLSRAAADAGARFVYVSSNAVFGRLPAPYSSDSPYSPINAYGHLKVEAEEIAQATCKDTTIVRPLLTYGWTSPIQRSSIVEQWVQKLNAGETIQALTDTFNAPIYGGDCARVIWRAATMSHNLTHNIGGLQQTSLFEFAKLVAGAFHLNAELVLPCTADELGLAADRPKIVAYEPNSKFIDEMPPLRGIEASLAQMRRERF